ncbi:MAG TPA: hypothetical protein VFF13_01340 [archaeon]|nr:hypothetical protein [archaeon]
MKIALVSSKKSLLQITPLIAASLKSQIKGVEVAEVITSNNLDLVKKVHDMKHFDLIVVILYFEESSHDINVVMEKLVDFDLGQKHTLKFLEQGDEFDETEESNRISEEIMLKLFRKKKTRFESDRESFTSL